MFKQLKKFFKEGSFIIPLLYIIRFVLVIIVVSFSFIMYKRQLDTEVNQFKFLEEERISVLKSNIENISDLVISDLLVGKKHYEFTNYLGDGQEGHTDHSGEDHKKNLIDELVTMVSLRKIYDQVRFIKIDGSEDFRVNHRAGLTYVTPEDELQNKFDRYYFKETIKLDEGEIFVSPLDLNIEDGEIEHPIKPMIRLSTPIFFEGEIQGILIFNYLAQELLDSLENSLNLEGEKIFLVNEEGYWLKGPNPKDEWGFMYDDASKTIFSWDSLFSGDILSENRHQGIHPSGLFTTTTVEPFDYSGGIKKKLTVFSDSNFQGINQAYNEKWKIISFLPKESLYRETNKLALYLIITNVIIVSLLISASSILIYALKERLTAEKVILKLNETLKIITKVLRHDLANDFTHIKFSLELFRENKKEKEFLTEVGTATEHGISTIMQMKELEGMVDQGAKLKKVNLKTVLDKIVKEYQIEFNIKGNASIKADDGLNSVFNNIISNAIRHGKTKKLDIKISEGKKKVIVKFIDYGKGVPDVIKKDIFNEGFKYGESANTGLGLYIVDQTVKRYGGKIWVEDNKPKGAIFIMEFPI